MGARVRQLEGSFVARAGGRLWVEQAGQGPVVVLAHAGIADGRMWDNQVAALADRYQVVRYDQSGYGRSDRATERYSYVEELGAVLDHVGAGQAALVGCSKGGRVALDYTLAYPDPGGCARCGSGGRVRLPAVTSGLGRARGRGRRR